MDYLRRLGLEKGKPLTPLKVCHAKSDWKLTNPLTPASVRGDKRNVCFTNNFLYLTYCKLGSDKRVLGFMKLKHGNKEAVSILEFVGTKIDQFRYVGKGGKKDLSEPAEPAEESSGNKGGPVGNLNMVLRRSWSFIIWYSRKNVHTKMLRGIMVFREVR